MRLTQKAQVTLFGACVASLIFAGTGYAQAKSVEAKYEEQSKQIELYKDELNDMQGQLQEYTKYKAMYECIAVEKDQLQKEVEELSKWKALGVFRITAYWYGEDEYGDLTATGVRAQVNHTIAVDPQIIPYGSKFTWLKIVVEQLKITWLTYGWNIKVIALVLNIKKFTSRGSEISDQEAARRKDRTSKTRGVSIRYERSLG